VTGATESTLPESSIAAVHSTELRRAIGVGEPVAILDVRAAEEFGEWHVDGERATSENLPYVECVGDITVIASRESPRAIHPSSVRRAARASRRRGPPRTRSEFLRDNAWRDGRQLTPGPVRRTDRSIRFARQPVLFDPWIDAGIGYPRRHPLFSVTVAMTNTSGTQWDGRSTVSIVSPTNDCESL